MMGEEAFLVDAGQRRREARLARDRREEHAQGLRADRRVDLAAQELRAHEDVLPPDGVDELGSHKHHGLVTVTEEIGARCLPGWKALADSSEQKGRQLSVFLIGAVDRNLDSS
jgi:hypothetical protein